MSHPAFRTAAVLVVAGLAVGGCSFSSKPFSAAELEQTTFDELSSGETEDKVLSITCDGELQPEVGATQTCHGVYESGLNQELKLEVESIVDDTANFTYAPGPSFIDGESVAKEAVRTLTGEGLVAEDVECQQIEFTSDATSECTATIDGDPEIAFMAVLGEVDPATGEYTMTFRAV